MKKSALLVAVSLSGVCVGAHAQQAEEERPYDASASIGYVGTTGNTEVTTLNTEFLLTYRQSRWTHDMRLRTLTSQENGIGKAERYSVRDKSDFSLDNDVHYLYVEGSYIDDRFSGFNYQALLSVGYGRYFLNNDKFVLEGFSGLGYRRNSSIMDGTEGEAVLTLGQEFDWTLSETSALTQALTFEIGDKRTITTFSVGLESNIIQRIATKIAFEARNTSDVPPGIKKTDTQTSVSLVYTF